MENLAAQRPDPFSYYTRLERVRAYVREHIGENVSLGDAAREAGLERKYFSYFFKIRTGVLFGDWLRRERIDHAKRLLQSKNHQVTEVAYLVGYQHLTSFERAFKRETGLRPLQYKKTFAPHLCVTRKHDLG